MDEFPILALKSWANELTFAMRYEILINSFGVLVHEKLISS